MVADDLMQSRVDDLSTSPTLRDQYADGRAAKMWEAFIGDKGSRTENYKTFLLDLLRTKGCTRILDVACGTGVDSTMLIEEGFSVVSVDASDKMLKYALKERWNRRKDPGFDDWIIEEANWLTLYDDIEHLIGDGFDAVICLGNSFAHMLDSFGDQREQKLAIKNFERCVRPGGLLIIDHRNYDSIMDTGSTPVKNIYYNSKHTTDIKTSVLYVGNKPSLITLDYIIKMNNENNEFRLSYYPHKLSVFSQILSDTFGPTMKHTICGDFKSLNEVENPAFYVHIVEKNVVDDEKN